MQTHDHPFAATKTRIIPIGNNIPVAAARVVAAAVLGVFRPDRPGERSRFFIETIKTLRARGSTIEVVVMGAVIDDEAVTRVLETAARAYRFDLLFNLPENQVSELQCSACALLPFPDGVSEKRGSAMGLPDP